MMRNVQTRRTRACSFFALLGLLFLLLPAGAPVRAQALEPEFVPGEVLIGWQPGEGPAPEVQRKAGGPAPDQNDPAQQATEQAISRATGLAVLDASPEHGSARLSVAPGTEAEEIARLEALPWVLYAEPNYYAYAAGDTRIPNDPDYPKQWNMEKVSAPMAWAATRGSPSYIVAVLDTGVAQSHPEFVGKLLAGRDYVNNDLLPEDDDPDSHGTHVTGIIAAGFDNGQGVAGLAPDVKILPLKVLDSQRVGTYSAIAQAMYDAVTGGAKIINMSLAGYASSFTLEKAAADVVKQGILVVAAAGNCAQSPSTCGGMVNPDMYPAAYPGVLAVSASDRLDRGTIYSGYKPYIGLAAPGGISTDQVWSTTRYGYNYMYGTSMSTPMATAAAALVWTLKPAATAQDVIGILKNTADKVGTDPYSGEPFSYTTGRNDYFGSGRLNVGQAACSVYPLSLTATAGLRTFLLGEPLTTQSLMVELTSSGIQDVPWQATVVTGQGWLSVSPASGVSSNNAPGRLTLTAKLGQLTPGVYIGIISVQPVHVPCLNSFGIVAQLKVVESVSQTWLPSAVAAH
jgi:subtilisin family serine protease